MASMIEKRRKQLSAQLADVERAIAALNSIKASIRAENARMDYLENLKNVFPTEGEVACTCPPGFIRLVNEDHSLGCPRRMMGGGPA